MRDLFADGGPAFSGEGGMRLRSSFYLSFMRTMGQSLIQFFSGIVIARLLEPAEFGVFLIAFAAVTTLGALREFGITRYMIKEREFTEAKLATVYGVAIIIGWSLGAALFLGRNAVARFYGASELSEILAVLAATYLILPIGQPALARMLRDQRHGLLALNALVSSVAGATVSITLVALGSGAIGLAFGALAGTLLASLLALRVYPEHVRMLPSLSEWRSVLGFGTVATLGAIVAQLGQHAPALVLGRLMGSAETALFQRASSLATVVSSVMVTSSNWVTGAAMGQLHRSGADMSQLAIRTTSYLTAIGWPGLVFLAAKSDAIIYLLYGENWLPSAPLVPPLCLAIAFTVFASQATAVYDGTGAAGLHLRNHSLALMVALGLLVIGAQYGLVVVAWLRALAMGIRALIHFTALQKLAGIGAWRMLAEVRRSLGLTALFALAVAAMIAIEPDGLTRDPVTLLVEMLGSGLIYLGLVFVVRHPLRQEVLHLLRKLRGQA